MFRFLSALVALCVFSLVAEAGLIRGRRASCSSCSTTSVTRQRSVSYIRPTPAPIAGSSCPGGRCAMPTALSPSPTGR